MSSNTPRRSIVSAVALLIAFTAAAAPPASGVKPMTAPLVKKTTAVVVVDRIEPVVEFWKRVGVEKVMDVPEGEGAEARLGFAILAGPGVEVMYQTSSSVQADLVASAAPSYRAAFRTSAQQAYLFVEVASIAALEQAMAGEKLVMRYRETFYGAKELGYDDRAGNIVIFAEMPAQ